MAESGLRENGIDVKTQKESPGHFADDGGYGLERERKEENITKRVGDVRDSGWLRLLEPL